MHAKRRGGFSDPRREIEGRGAQYRETARKQAGHRLRFGDVERLRRYPRARADTGELRFRTIGHDDAVVAALSEHVCDGGADLAGSDHQNVFHGFHLLTMVTRVVPSIIDGHGYLLLGGDIVVATLEVLFERGQPRLDAAPPKTDAKPVLGSVHEL